MITKEQFYSLKVGDRVLHSQDRGLLNDLRGSLGTVTKTYNNVFDTREIEVQWEKGLNRKQTYGAHSLDIFDPYPQFSTININEII